MTSYTPSGPVSASFHKDNNRHRVLIGPFGSGKSVSCCVELMKRAVQQSPNNRGVRKTRWAIIRNTYVELRDTTLNSWKDWWGDLGHITSQPPYRHKINLKLDDQTRADIEILFLAMDRPDQVKKLLSLELTGAWVNEAREVPQALFKNLLGRCGRYPNKRDGGASWYGVIADTNPPDTDHWIYKFAEEVKPEGWQFFHQPGGLIKNSHGKWIENPDAENRQNLPPNYYLNQVSGNSDDWVSVHLGAQYGFVSDGLRPVFPQYRDHQHLIKAQLHPTLPITIGLDFGLTPAAVLAQKHPSGCVHIFDELYAENVGMAQFSDILKSYLKKHYPTLHVGMIYADPAGNIRSQTDLITPFQILRQKNFPAQPAHQNNNWSLRREAVIYGLETLIDQRPLLSLSPKAQMLRKALSGKYYYKRLSLDGEDRYKDVPDKNKYSHISDALQYLCLGVGFGRDLVSRKDQRPSYQAQTDFSLFSTD